MTHAELLSLCNGCEYRTLPAEEMPCKKCFKLPFKPHYKAADPPVDPLVRIED